MVRILKMVIVSPAWPSRLCRKMAGPRDVNLTRTIASSVIGPEISSKITATTLSNKCLTRINWTILFVLVFLEARQVGTPSTVSGHSAIMDEVLHGGGSLGAISALILAMAR
jgi:hypothetical protein